MSLNSIITFVLIILIHEGRAFALLVNESVCFINGNKKNDSWCSTELKLCGDIPAYDMSVNIKLFESNGDNKCGKECLNPNTDSLENHTSEISIKCNGKSHCPLTDIPVPSALYGGILTLTFVCNITVTTTKPASLSTTTMTSARSTSEPTIGKSTTSTENSTASTENSTTSTENSTTSTENSTMSSENRTTSTGSGAPSTINSTEPTSFPNGVTVAQTQTDNPYTAAIVVSVIIPAIIAVVVVAVMMYRRDKCELRFVKCLNMHDKHTSDTVDAYAMSSRANVNLTYDLSRGVDVNGCNVDYCEIDKVGKETDVKYSHVNLEKKQAVQDPTYNHIEHFNISSGNAEQTYNHVGDETLRITESSTLQPDTYSHIGAMAKPASEQLTDYSYAHINGVMKYTPEANDINPYDCAVLETNCGPTGIFGHQACKMKSGKEKKFYVVGPSKVDVNNEDPVSHSYFILEKHEKKA